MSLKFLHPAIEFHTFSSFVLLSFHRIPVFTFCFRYSFVVLKSCWRICNFLFNPRFINSKTWICLISTTCIFRLNVSKCLHCNDWPSLIYSGIPYDIKWKRVCFQTLWIYSSLISFDLSMFGNHAISSCFQNCWKTMIDKHTFSNWNLRFLHCNHWTALNKNIWNMYGSESST